MTIEQPSRSLWLTTAGAGPRRPPVADGASADVVVIGAGIAGLTTALLCRRAGHEVLLLEAERVAEGATAYSTVKVTAQHGSRYSKIADAHGVEAARVYARANMWGLEEIVRLSVGSGIDCDLRPVPHQLWADTQDDVEALERELDVEREAGLTVQRLDTLDVPFPVTAALSVPHQAIFHPVKYLRGLATALEREGGVIAEDSRVHAIEDGDITVLHSDSGRVTARHVVVATHAPIFDDGLLFSRYVPRMEYAIAVRARAPVPDVGAISIGDPTRSFRPVDVEGERLLIAVGEGHKVGEEADTESRYRALTDWADDAFGVDQVVARWCTHDLWPVDHLPLIGRMEGTERRYVLTAFGGWGMTNATAGAAVIRDAIAGVENEWAQLFAPGRHHVRGGLGTYVKENVKAVAGHLVAPRLTSKPEAVTDLGLGEADVFSAGGRQVAAYRDHEGTLHAVSASCTHLGCVVGWNPAERTWDCPCHGSRFSPDGDVISAPATEPLAPFAPSRPDVDDVSA